VVGASKLLHFPHLLDASVKETVVRGNRAGYKSVEFICVQNDAVRVSASALHKSARRTLDVFLDTICCIGTGLAEACACSRLFA
jgi:hypothetical protein